MNAETLKYLQKD